MRVDGKAGSPLTDPAAAASKPTATRDEFLRLFVAQLKNQDPLSPQDNAAFVAQLAQFAQLEQIANTNTRLDAIMAEQATSSGVALASMVGRNVLVHADILRLDRESGTPPLVVDLERPAVETTVVIRNASGQEVRRIDLGAAGPGLVDVKWDGLGADGLPLPEGDYSIEVKATGPAGDVPGQPMLHGILDAVDFTTGSPRLRLGRATVTPSEVVAIGQ
jgi:flagellar basal-body rod modification protein FlgD